MFNHEPHNLDDTCEFTFTRDNNFYETTYNKLKKGDNYINQINSTDLKNITNIDDLHKLMNNKNILDVCNYNSNTKLYENSYVLPNIK